MLWLRGSSPRMWGLRAAWRWMQWAERFIPTYVGFTIYNHSLTDVWTVHPHVCGVYVWSTDPAKALPGSSPRMWGLP